MLSYNSLLMGKEQAVPMETYKKRISRRSFFRLAKDTLIGDVKTLHKTVVEAAAFKLLVTAPLVASGYDYVQFAHQEDQSMNPTCRILEPQVLIGANIAAPIIEELDDRLLPSVLLGRHWGVGVLTSARFAFGHGQLKTSLEDSRLQVNVDISRFPIHYFIGGLYLWNVFKNRGYLHAVVAHSTYNLIGTAARISGCLAGES